MVIITAGGTGGHLIPAVALAEEIQQIHSDYNPLLVGTQTPLDRKIFEKSGIPFQLLDMERPGKGLFGKIKTIFVIWKSFRQSLKIIQETNCQLIVACGGFGCVPMALASRWKKIPLVLLEQNAVPGRTNKFLAGWTRNIFVEFEEAGSHFKKGLNIEWAGNPLKKEILQLKRAEEENSLLVMGGSQGASAINEIMKNSAKILNHKINTLKIIHIAGKSDREGVQNSYHEAGIQAEVYDFLEDMSPVLKKVSAALSRSGAGSIAELAALGIPSILIPFPFAKDNHQLANAKALEKREACILLEEKDLTPDILVDALITLLTNKEERSKMTRQMKNWSQREAGKNIARILTKKFLEKI